MKRSVRGFFDSENAPLVIQSIDLPELKERQVSLDLVRDDLFHPMIAGNKWWKLKHALIHAAEEGIPRLVTFGGAYSNHILAVAAAGHLFGFETIGIIRGEESREFNPVLSQAKEWGMRLQGISRESYRLKNTPDFLEQIKQKWSPCLIIPEGGTSSFAVKGTCEMTSRLQGEYTIIYAAL
jgi:1-aminocyclopropane-1-carboxylate deaminase